VTIGWIGPKTGPMAIAGNYAMFGAQKAIYEINASGGIHGRTIDLFCYDTVFDPMSAVAAVRKLIGKRVVAILGDLSSSGTLATMKFTQKYGIPQISYSARAPGITQAMNPFIFTVTLNSNSFYKYLAYHAIRKQNIKNIAIFGYEDKYSIAEIKFLIKQIEKLGGRLVKTITYPPESRDFGQYFEKVRNAEAIILTGTSAESALIIRQARQLGFKTRFFGVGPVQGIDLFMKKIGGEIDNVTMVYDFSYEHLEKKEMGKVFIREWVAKYGRHPEFFSVMAYDATKMLCLALKNIKGEITGSALREQLISIKDYKGLLGDMSFSKTGEINRPLFLYDWKKGKYYIQVVSKHEE
jgi:branched-chain amino acid transport system substrate-binding protein